MYLVRILKDRSYIYYVRGRDEFILLLCAAAMNHVNLKFYVREILFGCIRAERFYACVRRPPGAMDIYN